MMLAYRERVYPRGSIQPSAVTLGSIQDRVVTHV